MAKHKLEQNCQQLHKTQSPNNFQLIILFRWLNQVFHQFKPWYGLLKVWEK